MEPVINPWWFYFASVANGLIFLEVLVMIISSVVFIVSFGYAYANWGHYDREDKENYLSLSKKSCLVFIIASILSVLTPSKETLIQMLLANSITYDLVDQTTDVVTTVYNDIIGLFNE